jgi:SSS family solute:Na+ symporter
MSLSRIDLFVVAGYFIMLTLFGAVVRRTRGFEDFAVAKRSVPVLMVFASLCAAYIGPGYSLGFTAKAFGAGFAFLPAWFCFSLQTCVVGVWLAPRLRSQAGAHTLGGVMMNAYGPTAKVLTGIVSVGLCVGLAGVLARAGGTILAGAIGVNLPIAILLITGVGVVYTLTGGLKSVVATEGLQFSVVLISMGAVIAFAGHRIASSQNLDNLAVSLTSSTWKNTSVLEFVGLMLLFFAGEMLIPPYANRALAAESEGASGRGFVMAGIFSLFWFAMMATAGIQAREILGSTSNPDGVLIQLAHSVLPSGVLGLFLVALAAIVMSTQESLLNAASVCLTRDLMPSKWSDTRQLAVARISTLIFALCATWFGLRAPSILTGLLIAYSMWAPTILPALVWWLLGNGRGEFNGVLSIISGGLASTSILIFHIASGNPAVAIVVGLLASISGGLVGGRVMQTAVQP